MLNEFEIENTWLYGQTLATGDHDEMSAGERRAER
jgi:hypothetical protein